jgi:hypothetical protein
MLQGHNLLLAHPVTQETGAIAIAAMELHVCPTIGEADNGVGIVEDLRHRAFVNIILTVQKGCL